jgi:putative DNA primase/helicase
MFMPVGRGSNGKNVLIDALRDVAGDYCEVMPSEILLATKESKSAEQASPVTRKLAGARCAVTSENKEDAKLDVAVVKRHTGDSKMTARDVYEKSVTFDITHKLVLLTNHPPRVDQMDDAIKGRLHVIPFDMRWNRPGTTEYNPTIPDADKELPAKLKAEAEGVLRYFVEGAVLYFKEGLIPPPEVTAFTQGYITAQDTVRRWLSEECTTCDDGDGTTAAQLHASYRSFCAGEGEREQVDNPAALGRRLSQMGYQGRKTREGKVYPIKPKSPMTPIGMAFQSLAAPVSRVM